MRKGDLEEKKGEKGVGEKECGIKGSEYFLR